MKAEEKQDSSIDLLVLEKEFIKRANQRRWFAGAYFLAIIMLAGSLIWVLLFIESIINAEEVDRANDISNSIDEIQSDLLVMKGKLDSLARISTIQLKGSLTLASKHANRIKDMLGNIQLSETKLKYFVSILVTRFTLILILIYLLNFFVSLFKYNSRLITFYHSRALFMKLLATKGDEVALSFAKFFEAEKIDFKNTKSPDQQAVELAKTIISKSNEK